MFKKITIIGLGLMGGSLAAACRKKFPKARIIGISRSREALTLAKKKKWVHEATRDVRLGVKQSDLVILCTPVGTFLPYLRLIDKVCSKGALVMDIGSVKASVLKEANSREWKSFSFVGCHPMVGSHRRGVGAVNPALYKGGLVLITRDRKTCSLAYIRAKKFWLKLSSRIAELSPQVHDTLVGEISHLPHTIAFCLMQAVSAPALKIAATGFRDVTRIASSDPSIWLPILKANRDAILSASGRFEKELKKFKKILRGADSKALARYLAQAQKKREAL